jgi:hypothetical protein
MSPRIWGLLFAYSERNKNACGDESLQKLMDKTTLLVTDWTEVLRIRESDTLSNLTSSPAAKGKCLQQLKEMPENTALVTYLTSKLYMLKF